MSGFRNPLTPERLQSRGELLYERTWPAVGTGTTVSETVPLDTLAGHSTVVVRVTSNNPQNESFLLTLNEGAIEYGTQFARFPEEVMSALALSGFAGLTYEVRPMEGFQTDVTVRIYGFRGADPALLSPGPFARTFSGSINAGSSNGVGFLNRGPLIRRFRRLHITTSSDAARDHTVLLQVATPNVAGDFSHLTNIAVGSSLAVDGAGINLDVPFPANYLVGVNVRNDGGSAATFYVTATLHP